MKRILKSATVFATILSLGLAVSAVQASGTQNVNRRITKPGQGVANKNTNPTQGSNPTGNNPSNPSQPAPVWKKFPPNSQALKSIFNQTNQTNVPPVWKKFPPGSAILNQILNTNPNPNPSPKPNPKPTKPNRGSGFGVYVGGPSGVAVVPTSVVTAPVDVPAVPPAPAPASTTSTSAEKDDASVMEVAVGSSFTIKGEKFGDKPGQIGLVVGGVLIPVQVTAWSDTAVTVNVPMLGVDTRAKATFVVKLADGSVAQGMDCELVNAR